MSEAEWTINVVGHALVDPRTLLRHPDNPKVHTAEQDQVVSGSLRELGWIKSLTVNEVTGHILDGDERTLLALVKGAALVPVEYVRVPADKEGEALLLLDPSGQLAKTHIERWARLQTQVQTTDTALLAFLRDQAKQHGVIPGTTRRRAGAKAARLVQEAEVHADVQALIQQWGVEEGQVWQCGDHLITCGDSLEAGVLERLRRTRTIDLVVTSPPYAVDKDYEVGVRPDQHRDLLRALARRCTEVVKPGGYVVLNFADLWAQAQAAVWTGSTRACCYPMSQEYWQVMHGEFGWDLFAQRIWKKPFATLKQPLWTYHSQLAHQQEFEHVWTWRLPGGPQQDEVFEWDVSVHAVWDTSREKNPDEAPSAYWTAAFPVCMPERALRAHSAMDQVVWEPFLGSGATLLACEGLGRVCLGSDRDPGAIAMTLERYQALTGEAPRRLEEPSHVAAG